MSEGGVILYPTDTIWGIGCDATNEEAVRRVYEIKQRSDSKAMLVLVDSPVKVDFYVQDVPEVAWDLIELADKPLTIIYSGESTNTSIAILSERCLISYTRRTASSLVASQRYHPFPNLHPGIRKRNIPFFLNHKKRSKQCCLHGRICRRH